MAKRSSKKPNKKTIATIGTFIRETRLRKGVHAKEIAKVCNVTTGRLYQWETADFVLEKNFPGLARILRVPLGRLKALNGKRVSAAS